MNNAGIIDAMTFNDNGNPTRVENDSTTTVREMYWDEDNRLMVLSDNGKTSRYTYNHAGERAVKSHGSMEGVYINGAPQGITFHETDEYTLYPASIISVNKNRFTKHYFIGDKRIASRIGSGSFNNVYGQNGSFLTAGQQDYAERLNQIETQREDYYRELGIAPGIPTMKGSYGDPENTGVGYNTIIKELGDHTVPAEWAQYVKHNTEADTAPGAPIQWDDPSDPESAQPGYGFVADNSTEEETFYYHSDHLGSTSYITDKDGNITQYDAYLPYGELLVDEHSSSEELPYKFNGKELDEETGSYYYGARYMQPVASIWYGVDPLTEEYTEISGYVYCHANPVRLIDPDGNGDKDENSAISVTLSLGFQFGIKIGKFEADVDFGSYNVELSEKGTNTYLSSGMGVGLGIVSFETRNTRTETTQKVENSEALPSFMPKHVNVTKEERETKLSVTTPVVTLAETGFHKKKTITYKNAEFSNGKIVKGKRINNSDTKGTYFESVAKLENEGKNYSKKRETKFSAKCIIGLSLDLDWRKAYNKVKSLFSK